MIGIFIPYRNRKEHLEILLDKLSKYENISIHILEQSNNELFNRGKLFNIGANEYLDKYDYFIFHDVDLIPQDENYNELYNESFKSDISNNTFNNSQSENPVDPGDPVDSVINELLVSNRLNNIKHSYPTHLSCYCEQFNYKLFDVEKDQSNNYLKSKMFGGVIGITKNDFIKINGYSNLYEGWGCEDNDIFNRIEQIIKTYSRKPYTYKSLEHNSSYDSELNPNLYNNLIYLNSKINYMDDGLNKLVKTNEDNNFKTHLEYTFEIKNINNRIFHHYINFESYYKKDNIITIYINELNQKTIDCTIKYAYTNNKSILLTSSILYIPTDFKYFYNNNNDSYILRTYKQYDDKSNLKKINSWNNNNLFSLDKTISYLISCKDLKTVIANNYNYSSIKYKNQEIKEFVEFNKFNKLSNSFSSLKYKTPLISKINIIFDYQNIINIRTKYSFNYYIYYLLNNDLNITIGLLEENLTNHFINRGIIENRLIFFNLPEEFNYLNYYQLNPDLRFLELNELELSKHYILNGKNELRKYDIESLYKINNINWDYFRYIYKFDKSKPDIELVNYWLDNKDNLQTPLLNYTSKQYPQNGFKKKLVLLNQTFNLQTSSMVLILTHPGGGGVEKYLSFLKNEYKNNIILRPNCDKNFIYQLEIEDEIKYFHEIYIENIISIILKYSIVKIIVNHLSIFTPQFLQLCIDIKKIYKCKIIVILHDFSFMSFKPNITFSDINNLNNNIDNPYYQSRLKLLENSDTIIAPSNFIKNIYSMFFKNEDIYKLYHPDIKINEINKEIIINNSDKIKILIIGNSKGIDEILEFEKTIDDTIELIYLGKNDIISNKIKNYSEYYSDSTIKDIIDKIKPDIFWFPSKIPEIYCYALSHPIILGYPIIAYNIGSFTERLSSRKMTWLLDINERLSDHIDNIIVEYKKFNLNINNIEYVNEYQKKIINESEYFNYFV